MPGALIALHKLQQLATAPQQEVRLNAQILDAALVGMRIPVEATGEHLLDRVNVEVSRRQAD